MFTDRVILEFTAGKGGNGTIAFRREKYIPKGGPSGGDGGDGGSIILQGSTQLFSLESYRNHFLMKADDGDKGGVAGRHGKRGRDLTIKVPLGTLVKRVDNGEILHDVIADGQQWVICQGGKGGKGNTRFKSAINRAPHIKTDGLSGESHRIELELKLIADVGFVGFPNAGKSTLLSRATSVKVKIAPYPFTTLQPNLGYFFTEEGEKILLADIPGIIEGAHQNKGLGFEFLRHIERTHLLLFLLDASGMEGRVPLEDYNTLLSEIGAYNKELLDKPRVVALNKVDHEEAQKHVNAFRKSFKGDSSLLFEISAATGQGVEALMAFLNRKLSR